MNATNRMACNTFNAQTWGYRATLAMGLLVFWGLFGLFWQVSLSRTAGHFFYPLDDTYITMAIARNLADHGTWGPVAHEFSACASSPLWVLALAAVYRLCGPNEWAPLLLNLVSGTGLVVVVCRVLRGLDVKPFATLTILLAVILLTPLVPVGFTGLEHLLQVALTLAFVYAAAGLLESSAPRQETGSRQATGKTAVGLLMLAPLMTLVRYEGAFVIGAVAVLLLYRRRTRLATGLLVLGALPPVVAGMIFLSKGWFFFPSSLVQKAIIPTALRLANISAFVTHVPSVLADPLHVYMAVLLAAACLVIAHAGATMLRKRLSIMAVVFAIAVLGHLQFARMGGRGRYDAYLICLALVIVGAMVRMVAAFVLRPRGARGWIRCASFLAATALLAIPIISRSIGLHAALPLASTNTYQQQYQMARFLDTYYRGAAVAANDIGAIDYFSSTRCLDLAGLSDIEVARMIYRRTYGSAQIRQIAQRKGVKMAIVYEPWYRSCGGLPAEWTKVGQWTIPENVVCAFDTVDFYATDPREATLLRERLEAFRRELPAGVRVKFTAYAQTGGKP